MPIKIMIFSRVWDRGGTSSINEPLPKIWNRSHKWVKIKQNMLSKPITVSPWIKEYPAQMSIAKRTSSQRPVAPWESWRSGLF